MTPPQTTVRLPPARRWVCRAAMALAACVIGCTSPLPQHPPAGPSTPVPESGTAAASAANAADTGPLAPLAWLAGCWQGTVNQREFREQWLPLRGGMLVGAGQQVLNGRMQDYEFLRLESTPDGVYFTQFSGEGRKVSFRLADTDTEDNDTIFTFANTSSAFPARLIYRRGSEGWLYQTIEGALNGGAKKVIYPLRRIDCETGELIRR